MVRPNTVLPLGNSEEGPEYDYADQVTFRVYDYRMRQLLKSTIWIRIKWLPLW